MKHLILIVFVHSVIKVNWPSLQCVHFATFHFSPIMCTTQPYNISIGRGEGGGGESSGKYFYTRT